MPDEESVTTPTEETPAEPVVDPTESDLQGLITQHEELRHEQSLLFAKMHSAPSGEIPDRPPYEVLASLQEEDREFDLKIAGLKVKIHTLHTKLTQAVPEKVAV